MELNQHLPELQPEQRQILDGLQEFGEQIADFYLDAVILRHQAGFKTKSHLLAHLAREINAALIQTLIPRNEKFIPKNDLSCSDTNKAEENFGNETMLSKIAAFLGTDFTEEFVLYWKEMSNQLPKGAHYKSGAYETTREPISFDSIWDNFEYKILLPIVGSRASRHDFIKRAIELNKPEEKNTIRTLKNLCRVQSNSRYFFENLKDIKWLIPLYNNNFFNYKTIPTAYVSGDLKRVDLWNPLIYLLWVSSQDLSAEPDLLKTLVTILKTITKQHNNAREKFDNYRVWWQFSNILGNLPLGVLDKGLLSCIRLWLIESNDPHLASHDIVHKIIPRFFEPGNDTTSQEHGLYLLVTLLELVQTDIYDEVGNVKGHNYVPIVHLDYINDVLKPNGELLSAISLVIEGEQIIEIANQLKLFVKNNKQHVSITSLAEDKLDEYSYSPNEVADIYPLLICRILKRASALSRDIAPNIINRFLFDEEFDLPIFKRMSFYLIGWAENGKFVNILGQAISIYHRKMFFDFRFSREVKYALQRNKRFIDAQSICMILEIIESGPEKITMNHYFKTHNDYKEYWVTEWIKILNGVPLIEDKYKDKLRNTYQRPEFQYDSSGIDRTISTPRNKPPLSLDSFMEMDGMDAINYLKTYTPTGSFHDPDVYDLQLLFSEAIKLSPDKYVEALINQLDMPYAYSTTLFHNLREAIKENRQFDLKKAMDFAFSYIDSNAFKDNQLYVKGSRNDSHKIWVIDDLSDFIAEVSKTLDKNESLEEIVESIRKMIPIIAGYLSPTIHDDIVKSNMDFVMYSLNNTNGKIVRAGLDFALLMARVHDDHNYVGERFDKSCRTLLETAYNIGVVDIYTHTGKYYRQFAYLDEKWQKEHVERILTSPLELSKAFIAGLLYNQNKKSKEIYDTVKPFYHLTINLSYFPNEGTPIITSYERDVFLWYLWEFDELTDKSIVQDYLLRAPISRLGKFINAVDYLSKDINKREQYANFGQRLIPVWDVIIERVSREGINPKEDWRSQLWIIIKYFKKIDPYLYNYISYSLPHFKYGRDIRNLIEELLKLSSLNFDLEQAKYITKIFSLVNLDAFPTYKPDDFLTLLEKIFKLDTASLTSEVMSLCNRLLDNNHYFVRPLMDQYQPGKFGTSTPPQSSSSSLPRMERT